MTELETVCLCLDALERAHKLLELGVISPEESEAVIYLAKRWLDAAVSPGIRRERQP